MEGFERRGLVVSEGKGKVSKKVLTCLTKQKPAPIGKLAKNCIAAAQSLVSTTQNDMPLLCRLDAGRNRHSQR